MRAAILGSYGEAPELGEFDEPARGEGQAVVEVVAAALNPVDLAFASGTFHAGSPPLPSVAGQEMIGRVLQGDALAAGALVYSPSSVAPHGSFAERTLIEESSAVEVPDGVDEALTVSFGIAGLAAWLPLEWRAELRQGETVLVLGASGPLGQIAVQAARILGAGRVIAAARSAEGLARARELGAHEIVQIGAVDDLAEAFREAGGGGVDVIVDPLWGEPAAAAVEAANRGARLVQIGQSAGAEATIASSSVRGKGMSILGHTNFVAPQEIRHAALLRMAALGASGDLTVDLERVALDGVVDAWRRQAEHPHRKLVLIP